MKSATILPVLCAGLLAFWTLQAESAVNLSHGDKQKLAQCVNAAIHGPKKKVKKIHSNSWVCHPMKVKKRSNGKLTYYGRLINWNTWRKNDIVKYKFSVRNGEVIAEPNLKFEFRDKKYKKLNEICKKVSFVPSETGELHPKIKVIAKGRDIACKAASQGNWTETSGVIVNAIAAEAAKRSR